MTFALTVGGPPGTGAATLYRIRPGKSPVKIKDIAKYQQGDPDPYNIEGVVEESNPYGLAALRDGSVLVADAAGNDLLRVWPSGYTKTVARIKPRVVPVPAGLPPNGPDGSPLPPAGTLIPSEGVATSVTVGSDGHYYVGELRGFPATPGKSQVWRIKPNSYGAVCDPASPYKGKCQRYADGFTSIVDLGAGSHHRIFVVQLAKVSWFQWELGGSPVGSLYQLFRGRHHRGGFRHELVPGQLVLPGGVAVSKFGQVYTSGPIFGPGAISRVSRG
ncbi:ScyD/ScyE family protein [Kribbella sp. NBC_01245]|uniref:ScyD/ScyE family protein n=1 Tax=Kribbella sp. NBC_01245 TaxID=2903578 RepID=UPI002E2943FF|nr:ScyD/ScyE family protein [Kribbella sp. NBC_01245]